MQVSLLSGIAGTEAGEFVQTYPLNLEPLLIDSKISKGQLRCAPGAVQLNVGPGADRGGFLWHGTMFRVMGTKLIAVFPGASWAEIGDVGGFGPVTFADAFGRFGLRSEDRLYYYDGALTQVTDVDLGAVIDLLWIDGYFMTTDGTNVIVTELSDPASVLPLKYGSAEEDPDPITGLIKYRNEAYVMGRYTIQLFKNVGGAGFPFATVKGASIPFGCVGPSAKCLLGDGFAFVGGAADEGLNVYIGGQAQAKEIGCRELCDALDAVLDPATIQLEQRASRGERRLMVHLPGETWVYLLNASEAAGLPIWYKLKSDENGYRLRNAVEAFGETYVGDVVSGALGTLSTETRLHFGIDPGWQFDCGMIYNEAVGAIVHSVELVGLPGRGGDGAVFMSTTRDGETFSIERSVALKPARRTRRLQWRPHTRIGNYLGLRFRGSGEALPGIAACEVKPQPLTS